MFTTNQFETGVSSKLFKTACITFFPTITTICVAPTFIKNAYNVAQSYMNCRRAEKTITGKNKAIQWIPVYCYPG